MRAVIAVVLAAGAMKRKNPDAPVDIDMVDSNYIARHHAVNPLHIHIKYIYA